MTEKIKTSNNRLKILYLSKILLEETDENHRLTMPQIIDLLDSYGIYAERKALYLDIEALKAFGLDIVSGRGSDSGYFVASRDYELPELKLLADAVTSSRFLTQKKANTLLEKLGSLCSKYEAVQLKRQVYIANREKSFNEKIYLTVDVIHRAINEKKQISFKYFDYDIHRKKHYRDGLRRCTPYALIWQDERYYLVAYYEKYQTVTNFRTDRMEGAEIIEDKGEPMPSDFNLSEYLNSAFSMFSGKCGEVKLKFHSSLVGAVIDRFGKDARIFPENEDYFTLVTQVQTERPEPFFGWLFQFGDRAEILSPLSLRERYCSLLSDVLETHKKKPR